MHLLCTIMVMRFTPHTYSFMHIVYINSEDFRVKPVSTYVSYIVFPIFLSNIWAHYHTFLQIVGYRSHVLE